MITYPTLFQRKSSTQTCLTSGDMLCWFLGGYLIRDPLRFNQKWCIRNSLPETKSKNPWKWWFPIGISFSSGLFSGDMLVSGRVIALAKGDDPFLLEWPSFKSSVSFGKQIQVGKRMFRSFLCITPNCEPQVYRFIFQVLTWYLEACI